MATPEVVAGLPKFMALRAKSNDNFMHYLGAYENYYECMSCSKPELKVTSSLVKLEVVASATDKSLVHIKCSSNSKYLRIFVKHRSVWIGATADTTEEDRTKAACTLFQPLPLAATSATLIRLLHVQSGKFLMPFFDEDQDDDLQGIASLGKDDENSRSKRTHFQVYPWEDKKDEEEEKPVDEEKKDCADEVERLKKEVEVKKREIKERDEVIKKKEEEIKGKNEEIEEMKTKKKEGGDGEEEEKKKKKKKEMEEKDERIKALEAELESLKGKVNKLKHALNILVTYAP